MKSTIINKEFKVPFKLVYDKIKTKVLNNGFILLHEIDTQKIVSKQHIKINPLKQLLFFKPTYIQEIIKTDPLAINDIPLKIIIFQISKEVVSVS